MAGVRWEEVKHNWVAGQGSNKWPAFKLLRAKVPGGWLITIQEVGAQTGGISDIPKDHGAPGGLTFVPDPNYSWAMEPIPGG